MRARPCLPLQLPRPKGIAALTKLPYLSTTVNEGIQFSSPLAGLPCVIPLGGFVMQGQVVPEGYVVNLPM